MKTYLGNGMYVAYDGYYLILTTENGVEEITNVICMAPNAFSALLKFVKQLEYADMFMILKQEKNT